MAVRTTNAGGEFQKAPEGMHIARCFKLIDCGTHINKLFGKKQRLAWIFWELPNALMDENDKGEKYPFVVGKRYGLSHNEKSILRSDLESWYGKTFETKALDQAGGFDLEKLISREAMINVVHSDDGKYANIKSVNPMPAGMACPAQINKAFVFSFESYSQEQFSKLSEKMQDFIKESDEFQNMLNGEARPKTNFDDMDDDIPF